jgi:hypothetical protein
MQLTLETFNIPAVTISPGLWKTTAQCPALQNQIIGASVHMDDHDAHSRVERIVMGIVGLSEKFVIFRISERTMNYSLPIINHPCMTELVIPQSDVSLPFWVHMLLVG